MRIILFAPTTRSLYSRLVAHELYRLPGIEFTAIYVRSLWSLKRFKTDLRREGPRLLRKINTKLLLPERGISAVKTPLAVMAEGSSLEGQTLTAFARRKDIAFHRVDDFNDTASERSLKAFAPDLIVFTGGGLIRENILQIPALGVLNCHSGLLPRYRGMDTLEWAILEAKRSLPQVGLTLHFMDAGVDTGPILRQHPRQLRQGEDLDSVRQAFEPDMVRLMIEGVRDLQSGELQARLQSPTEGRQYYVIHPRLGAKAAETLKRRS